MVLKAIRQRYPKRLVGLALSEFVDPILNAAPPDRHHGTDPLSYA